MIVRIYRHVACEGPGYLEQVLDKYGVPHETVAVDQGQPVTGDLGGVAGLVFMGGPMSVNDRLPWIEAELRLIGHAMSAGLPVLGHCLGGQLMAAALGAAVVPNPVREIGWHRVEAAATNAAADWLDRLAHGFDAFHWHGETFELPDGAEPLLSSRFCANQAFVRGNSLALQCHIEVTTDMVRNWARLYRDELQPSSPSVQSAAEMLADVEDRVAGLHVIADRVYARWLRPLLD